MTEGSNLEMDSQPGATSDQRGQPGDEVEALAFDIDEQPLIAMERRAPFERIDMVITGFPKPETRRLPFAQRLRGLLHG